MLSLSRDDTKPGPPFRSQNVSKMTLNYINHEHQYLSEMALNYMDRVRRIYVQNDIKLKNWGKRPDPRCNKQIIAWGETRFGRGIERPGPAQIL